MKKRKRILKKSIFPQASYGNNNVVPNTHSRARKKEKYKFSPRDVLLEKRDGAIVNCKLTNAIVEKNTTRHCYISDSTIHFAISMIKEDFSCVICT
jgi:hypothetical protein